MKKSAFFGVMLCMALTANAQGGNTRMGGNDGHYESLSERLLKIEKKTDAFNVFINYAACARASEADGTWTSGFANKDLRLEVKGNLTDKIFYRLRHRLNRSNAAMGEDNFAKATDIMMVGYNFSDKLSLMAGKMGQVWGGYEYDENPMYIYQYSDFLDNVEIFQAGAVVSYRPVPTQEIAFEVSDANNGKFEEEYGENIVVKDGIHTKAMEQANHPLTFIANWNGSFLDDKLQTRWAWGLQKQAKGTYSRMLTLGQRLNLPKLQWYVDYMGAFEDMDRLGIVTREVRSSLVRPNVYGTSQYFVRAGKVHYNTWLTKLNWQFAPQWNLMLKGTYETASMKNTDIFKDYRKSYGYLGSVEYYPDKTQDFRVFLAYIGQKVDYSRNSGFENTNSNRIELGFMYRIKCY